MTAANKTPTSPQPRWNFLVLVLHNLVMRTGWIFKTESIIIPALLDLMGGSGWLRGFLPMLNRLGQSVPPVLVASWIRQIGRKKWVLASCATAMGICFLLLALLWSLFSHSQTVWLPLFFLLLYGIFWNCVGIHNLSLSLVYGKLVVAQRRGQLMLIATTLGSVTAIGSAWLWMGDWLRGGWQTMAWLFVFSGGSFLLAGAFTAALSEPADYPEPVSESIRNPFREALRIFFEDRNFQILAWVAACFGVGATLVPHYQAYVKQAFEIELSEFVPWVIAQNLGAGFFSIPLGRVADRFGNRAALRLLMLLLGLPAILTIVLVNGGGQFSRFGFYIVFFLLGMMPISMRVFNNYTLEIADRENQPAYLSTLGICMAVPVLVLSVLVGWLVDIIGFQPVFLIVLAVLLVGWVLTHKLVEPRTVVPANSIAKTKSN